jgi:hypothetical protein
VENAKLSAERAAAIVMANEQTALIAYWSNATVAAIARAEKAEAAIVQWKAHAATWAACLRLSKNDHDVATVAALIDAALADEPKGGA